MIQREKGINTRTKKEERRKKKEERRKKKEETFQYSHQKMGCDQHKQQRTLL